MASTEIVFQSATELGRLLKARQLSPVEVVRAYLDRIEALNPKSQRLHHGHWRAGARSRRGQRKKRSPPGAIADRFHGLPYAVKDMLATKGIRTTNGSKVTADWIPTHESTVTARLNRAGAILDRQTQSAGVRHGQRAKGTDRPGAQPVGPDYSPSGSSSGSGASVAGRHDAAGDRQR